jgi:membrane fusion protein (multidrug efflux system)
VASATTNLARVKLDLDRAKKLVESGALAQAQLDQAQSAHESATAALDQARARLASLRASTSQAVSKIQEASARVQQSSNVDALIEQARSRARMAHAQVAVSVATRDLAALDLSYTRIVAPEDGTVSKKTIAVGQMVAPGQGIVKLVPVRDLWITGNFKETQIHKMRAGQPAHVAVDAFPGVTLRGEVESFSAATGARFTLLPPDNASGNYTKVVQRVPGAHPPRGRPRRRRPAPRHERRRLGRYEQIGGPPCPKRRSPRWPRTPRAARARTTEAKSPAMGPSPWLGTWPTVRLD